MQATACGPTTDAGGPSSPRTAPAARDSCRLVRAQARGLVAGQRPGRGGSVEESMAKPVTCQVTATAEATSTRDGGGRGWNLGHDREHADDPPPRLECTTACGPTTDAGGPSSPRTAPAARDSRRLV